jgi:hypothetical protein
MKAFSSRLRGSSGHNARQCVIHPDHLVLGLRGAGLDASSDGAVDVALGDPALVVVLSRSGGDTRLVGAGDGLGLDLLGLLGGAGSALGLGEEGLDPGLVDKVQGTSEGTSEEEVEEDAERGQC